MNKPVDEPSTTFESDPWIPLLFQPGNQFGIILVANWPPKESIMKPYDDIFLPKVKTCFKQEDFELDSKQIPAVYLYPSQHLHLTIATFTPFHESVPNNTEEYAEVCTKIMEKACAREDWPKGSFHIDIDRAQIGIKAGILMWNNEDGTVATMRKIIHEEYDAVYETNPGALNHRTLTSPGIIHSTFLRFGRDPITKGDVVQERFQEVSKDVKDIFGTIEVDCVRLVVERVPYMHIPFDESHVLTSFEASDQKEMQCLYN